MKFNLVVKIHDKVTDSPSLLYVGSSGSTQSLCHDESSVCVQMDISICTSIAYKSWAQANCKKTCNLCSGGSGLTTPARKFPLTGSYIWLMLGLSYNAVIYSGVEQARIIPYNYLRKELITVLLVV